MLRNNYKIKGTNSNTGRKKTLSIKAFSNEECLELASNEGLVEPFEISLEESLPPTEAQLSYAKYLKINIPKNITKEEISFLIDRVKYKDKSEPNPELIEYAESMNIEFSNYVGKKQLYDIIWDSLYGLDKIEFFIFCVYRWISDDRHGNLLTHKCKDKFNCFAKILIDDKSFINSLAKSYDEGKSIRFFGTLYVGKNQYTGGSTITQAYKTVVKFLKKEFGLKNRTFKYLKDESTYNMNSSDYGKIDFKEFWKSKNKLKYFLKKLKEDLIIKSNKKTFKK